LTHRGGTFHPGKWFREIGNVLTVEKKSLSSHLNHLQTDRFIAEIAGQKEEIKDSNVKIE